MEGPAGPSPCCVGDTTEPMNRLSMNSNCECDKTQSEVKVKSKRYGRGAVSSGMY